MWGGWVAVYNIGDFIIFNSRHSFNDDKKNPINYFDYDIYRSIFPECEYDYIKDISGTYQIYYRDITLVNKVYDENNGFYHDNMFSYAIYRVANDSLPYNNFGYHEPLFITSDKLYEMWKENNINRYKLYIILLLVHTRQLIINYKYTINNFSRENRNIYYDEEGDNFYINRSEVETINYQRRNSSIGSIKIYICDDKDKKCYIPGFLVSIKGYEPKKDFYYQIHPFSEGFVEIIDKLRLNPNYKFKRPGVHQ